MKVWIECRSPLLQKSLELFLVKYLSNSKKCDIIIRDEKCLNNEKCFYIGSDPVADLIKPFSKSQLILALESRYNEKNSKKIQVKKLEVHESMDFNILEKRIEFLTQEYQSNIIRAVKTFYEK